MPLTDKGSKVLAQLVAEYGKKKGEAVFHASVNSGKLTGMEQSKLDAALSRCDAAAKNNFRKPARKDGVRETAMGIPTKDPARKDGGREAAMKGPINKPIAKRI